MESDNAMTMASSSSSASATSSDARDAATAIAVATASSSSNNRRRGADNGGRPRTFIVEAGKKGFAELLGGAVTSPPGVRDWLRRERENNVKGANPTRITPHSRV